MTNKYPKYKKAGEGWLGEVPENWQVIKLKHIFNEKKITHNPDLNCGSISFGVVVKKDDSKVPFSTKASYQEVLSGEFLINPLNLNFDLKSLRIALSDMNVVVSSGYIVLKNHKEINKTYYRWLLHRYDVSYMKLLGSGVRQTINFNHIANSLLLLPPLPEQTAIANFLDEKTAKIDQAIAQKQKLIALLKERKQILIQNAVTKGLNPNAKLKDSGVEWIGEIPEEWEVKRLKYLYSDTFSGGTPSTEIEKYWNGGVKWLSSGDVKCSFLIETSREISRLGLEHSSSKIAKKGSVIIVTRSGILQHTLPIAVLLDDMAINQDIKCFLLKEKLITPTYLLCFVTGKNNEILVETRKQGATVESIEMEDFTNLIIPLPPLDEQILILDYVNKYSTKIEKSVALQETQIAKLKEYKATLINSAVTGKIKVC